MTRKFCGSAVWVRTCTFRWLWVSPKPGPWIMSCCRVSGRTVRKRSPCPNMAFMTFLVVAGNKFTQGLGLSVSKLKGQGLSQPCNRRQWHPCALLWLSMHHQSCLLPSSPHLPPFNYWTNLQFGSFFPGNCSISSGHCPLAFDHSDSTATIHLVNMYASLPKFQQPPGFAQIPRI